MPHIDPESKRKYKKTLQERSLPAQERIYCSNSSCASWIPPRHIDKAMSCATCQLCRTKSCIFCRGGYHAAKECPHDLSLRATLQLANDEGWRRCYSCKAVVEHNEGCIHMTCKCKAQFCYICGLQWRTCACSDNQLVYILQEAATRRNAIQARQAEAEAAARATEATRQAATRAALEEEAELREILQQIEAFEIQEVERLRDEEGLHKAAIESRRRAKEESVMELRKHYFELRNELDLIHNMQKKALSERFKAELGKVAVETCHRDILAREHAEELEAVERIKTAEISESAFNLDLDRQMRILKEREIEDDYIAELRAYWADRPEAEMKINEAREALRERDAVSYQRWDALRREKHQKIVDSAKHEVWAVKGRHKAEMEALDSDYLDEMEMKRRSESSEMWLEAVTKVRLEMLAAMEEDEYLMGI